MAAVFRTRGRGRIDHRCSRAQSHGGVLPRPTHATHRGQCICGGRIAGTPWTADLRSASRGSAKPEPSARRPANENAAQRSLGHRGAGEESVPKHFPFRPRLQSGNRDAAPRVRHLPPDQQRRCSGFRKAGTRSPKSPTYARFPPRPPSRSGSSASSAPPRGSIERSRPDPVRGIPRQEWKSLPQVP